MKQRRLNSGHSRVTRAFAGALLFPVLLSGCLWSTPKYPPEPLEASAPLQAASVAESAPARLREAAVSAEAPAAERPRATRAVQIPAPDESASAPPRLYEGSGKFLNQRGSGLRPVWTSAEGEVTLGFVDTEVREAVRAVLSDILQENYVVDPNVQGTITLRTARPVPISALVPTLQAALRMIGATMIREGDLYKVVPVEQAPRGAAPLAERLRFPQGPGYGVQVIPLQHIAAAEMAKILEPVVPAGSILRIDEARNLLLLGGTADEQENALEFVELFDVDWLSGMSFALVPLEFADPNQIVRELEVVFGDQAEGPLAGVVRFVPIARLNSLLVISNRPQYLASAESWIERLDLGSESATPRLFVYYVQHRQVAELSQVLNEIFAPSTSALPGLGSEPAPLAPPRLPEDDEDEDERPRPAPAALTLGDGFAYARESEIRIIPDEIYNALVILATPKDYKLVQAALEKLDIVPLQVLIEATIAEVVLNDELRYGLQWFFDTGDSEFSFSSAAAGGASPIFPGFNYVFQSTQDVRIVLDALDEVSDVKVISSPQLLVQDNQEARLQVGDQVPVQTSAATSVTDGDAPIVNEIEFRDTGVILGVTPHVNASGLVSMDIVQEVSDVVETTTSEINSPTIQQRKIESTVAIQSGQTVALGGLIRDSQSEGRSGLPVLSRIPILGNLFGATSIDNERTELLVLITPRVIRNSNEAQEVTEELRRRLRKVIPLGAAIE